MSFVVGTVGRMENVDAFIAAQDSIKSAAGDLGATSVRATQVILGGESQGTVQVAFHVDTKDAAMAVGAGMVKNEAIRQMMGAAGASVLRRSLMQVIGQGGEMTGKYMQGLMMKSSISFQAAAKDFERVWKNMQPEVNGMMMAQAAVVGPNPMGTHYFATYGDSIDAIDAAAARNWADPMTKSTMASTNSSVVGIICSEVLF